MADIEHIKQLREETGASPVEIKKALTQANGDIEKAKAFLSEWGMARVGKKADRVASDGIVDYYIHPNAKSGVLLDIRCETDFVAKSVDFKNLAHEMCLHIAAVNPSTVEELLVQPWVKDGSKTINDLIGQTIAKTGENIQVKAFTRYEI